MDTSAVVGTGRGGRITKQDAVEAKVSMGTPGAGTAVRGEKRQRMSALRRKLAQRLVTVKNETAMLTTFNEVDMQPIFDLRKKYKEAFQAKHGVGLGFMSFFTLASVRALQQFPAVASMIDGEDTVTFDTLDISVAVSGPKGLMVPVVRNADQLSFAGVEQTIKDLATKVRDGKITVDEMTGGVFTITNGGVFGSMLSTPIINPPQSAILGMHNIVERPVVKDGQIVIRPIMYVAMSYDHRIIDGRESVGTLVSIKEALENPVEHLMGGDPEKALGLRCAPPDCTGHDRHPHPFGQSAVCCGLAGHAFSRGSGGRHPVLDSQRGRRHLARHGGIGARASGLFAAHGGTAPLPRGR